MPSSAGDRIYQESDEVQRARKLVGSHADDIRLTHTTSHSALTSSLPGIVGRSAQELYALGDRWSKVGTRHSEELDALSRNIGDAGTQMTNRDGEEATRIANVPRDL
ncbi:hypothetical protein PDG61_20935 [Mycolicibacterium sp. BiH015]|uniref:hypothetical protein n=1 Tax=Mycolicibacterium sp. BiH015 TaxID=3018808 RepID=UPI0022E0FB8A|nr:hypothetical protein [Mycolicibacterium sp. BiH015]MDA2893393.1 hypothetical protein [Mycolicibacterium sp. BiH015]